MKANIRRGALIATIAAAFLLLLCGLLVGCGDKTPDNNGHSNENKVVAGIMLETRNAKTNFFVGDRFSTLGLGIRVAYTDGTESLILADREEVEILAPSLDAIGRKQVSVQYSGFMAEYTVVVSRLDGIELGVSNVRRDYTVGDELSVDGLSVSAKITTLNDLDEEVSIFETLGIRDYTVETPDLTTPGKKEVTVSYIAGIEYSNSFEVYVTPDVQANSILTFEGEGSLTLYITDRKGGNSASADAEASGWYLLVLPDGKFDMFQTSLRYTASNGSDVSDGSVQLTVSGDGVTASIDGKEFSLNIHVYRTIVFGWEKQVVGIQIDAPSTSKEYVVGDTFTYEGLKALAAYSDGSLEELEGGSFSVQAPSEASMNEVGVKTVTGIFADANGTEIPFSYQIYCVPDVSLATDRLVVGEDRKGSGATLEIYVTDRSAAEGWWGTEQYVNAWLLVKNADGTYEMYTFEYHLDTSVVSHFYEHGTPEGVKVYLEGDPMVLEINGKKFIADNVDLWHRIVIGWQ